MSAAQTAAVGAVPAGLKSRRIEVGSLWKDTPYFGPGLEADTEHMKAFPAGTRVAGILNALRTTKHEKENMRKNYACLTDLNGARFRIVTPGQLLYLLDQVEIGAQVLIEYLGTEEVEGFPKPVHKFNVDIIENVQ